ncbi:MAG: hypothetical protein PHT69_02120 [Bacteroidales bacterium]|nr:hypothetical protein [Bacteroidales bacterium]
MKLNINTDAAVKFTNKLEKLNKFAHLGDIPAAVGDISIGIEINLGDFIIDNNKKKKQQRNIMLSTRIK